MDLEAFIKDYITYSKINPNKSIQNFISHYNKNISSASSAPLPQIKRKKRRDKYHLLAAKLAKEAQAEYKKKIKKKKLAAKLAKEAQKEYKVRASRLEEKLRINNTKECQICYQNTYMAFWICNNCKFIECLKCFSNDAINVNNNGYYKCPQCRLLI